MTVGELRKILENVPDNLIVATNSPDDLLFEAHRADVRAVASNEMTRRHEPASLGSLSDVGRLVLLID